VFCHWYLFAKRPQKCLSGLSILLLSLHIDQKRFDVVYIQTLDTVIAGELRGYALA